MQIINIPLFGDQDPFDEDGNEVELTEIDLYEVSPAFDDEILDSERLIGINGVTFVVVRSTFEFAKLTLTCEPFRELALAPSQTVTPVIASDAEHIRKDGMDFAKLNNGQVWRIQIVDGEAHLISLVKE